MYYQRSWLRVGHSGRRVDSFGCHCVLELELDADFGVVDSELSLTEAAGSADTEEAAPK